MREVDKADVAHRMGQLDKEILQDINQKLVSHLWISSRPRKRRVPLHLISRQEQRLAHRKIMLDMFLQRWQELHLRRSNTDNNITYMNYNMVNEN